MIVPFTGGVTVRAKRWIVNVAPTPCAAVIGTEHSPVPEQASVQVARS